MYQFIFIVYWCMFDVFFIHISKAKIFSINPLFFRNMSYICR